MKLHPIRDLSQTKYRPKRAERSALDDARFKLMILGIIFFIAYILIALRLTELSFHWGTEKNFKYVPIPLFSTKRADILDTHGNIIATNLITSSLFSSPRDILDINDTAKKLSSVLTNLSSQEIKTKLQKNKNFVWLARNITPTQKIKTLALGLPGIEFSKEEKRVYPHGKIAAHIVGFTNIDNNGLAGIERFFNKQLLSSNTPLHLTLDMHIQAALEDELMHAINKFKAKRANAIIMDANTGEIIAMASLPSYDPNLPGNIKKKNLFSPNTLGVYDLGSIFKIFTAAMALDSGKITLKGGYDATKPIKVGKFTISDYLGGEKRWLSLPEIILYSSNIASAKMALDVGADLQKNFLKKLGLFKKVPIELPERGTPITPSFWGDVTTMTVSYGYGLAVSPLHIVRAFAALINGGYLLKPTLIKNNPITSVKTQVISEKTSKKIQKLLYLVTQKGTARKASVPGYFVGGKTGTAEKRNVGGKGFLKKSNITSFLGAFPIHKPKYVIYIQLDDPQGTEETHGFRAAGWNAAPTAGAIIRRIIPLVNMLPETNNDIYKLLHLDLEKDRFS